MVWVKIWDCDLRIERFECTIITIRVGYIPYNGSQIETTRGVQWKGRRTTMRLLISSNIFQANDIAVCLTIFTLIGSMLATSQTNLTRRFSEVGNPTSVREYVRRRAYTRCLIR